MKIVAVHKSDSTVPYLITICKDYIVLDNNELHIFLDNSPYRTDGSVKNDVIILSEDNWEWVDEWDLTEKTVTQLLNFYNKLLDEE